MKKLINELAKHRGEFEIVYPWKSVRHKTMIDARGHKCCPLNVLCEGIFRNDDLAAMAARLDVTIQDVSEFIEAADRVPYAQKELRSEILSVLGLEPQQCAPSPN